MIIFKRQLDLPALLKKKSFFLLGPRATGKSFLIREQLTPAAMVLDLLRSDLYLRLQASPWDLEAIIAGGQERKNAVSDGQEAQMGSLVVIDEIQKVPALLDEVHRLIEEKSNRFLLTGSSARKLKAGHANLLAGRAWTQTMHPLTFSEIDNFNLERYLRYGGLPAVYASDDPDEELKAYAITYLREEIQSEGLVRKIPQFARFLTVAALANADLVNFSALASDAQVPASTLREYFSVLEDTFIGFMLPPWQHARNRKAVAASKFYFFDVGVAHALAGTESLERNSDLYGKSFEHWIGLELRAFLAYRRKNDALTFWRSTEKHEVDFLIGDHTAIEVKATARLNAKDLKGLLAIQEEATLKRVIVVSQDPIETLREGIRSMHWRHFLEELWTGNLV